MRGETQVGGELHIFRKFREGWTREVDDIAVQAIRFSGACDAGRDDSTGIGAGQFGVLPSDPVSELQWFIGRPRRLGSPIGHDVVVDLILSGDLHQFDGPFTPVTLWRDPRAGALMVVRLQVLVAGKVAIPLHEAEPVQLIGLEGVDGQTRRVDHATP